MPERFAQGEWQTLVTQAPVLEDALVSFDCEVVQSLSSVATMFFSARSRRSSMVRAKP
jgi:flavin reductase (DIM6/NTAB) family NADH-FMN oxidoreductase RutF